MADSRKSGSADGQAPQTSGSLLPAAIELMLFATDRSWETQAADWARLAVHFGAGHTQLDGLEPAMSRSQLYDLLYENKQCTKSNCLQIIRKRVTFDDDSPHPRLLLYSVGSLALSTAQQRRRLNGEYWNVQGADFQAGFDLISDLDCRSPRGLLPHIDTADVKERLNTLLNLLSELELKPQQLIFMLDPLADFDEQQQTAALLTAKGLNFIGCAPPELCGSPQLTYKLSYEYSLSSCGSSPLCSPQDCPQVKGFEDDFNRTFELCRCVSEQSNWQGVQVKLCVIQGERRAEYFEALTEQSIKLTAQYLKGGRGGRLPDIAPAAAARIKRMLQAAAAKASGERPPEDADCAKPLGCRAFILSPGLELKNDELLTIFERLKRQSLLIAGLSCVPDPYRMPKRPADIAHPADLYWGKALLYLLTLFADWYQH